MRFTAHAVQRYCERFGGDTEQMKQAFQDSVPFGGQMGNAKLMLSSNGAVFVVDIDRHGERYIRTVLTKEQATANVQARMRRRDLSRMESTSSQPVTVMARKAVSASRAERKAAQRAAEEQRLEKFASEVAVLPDAELAERLVGMKGQEGQIMQREMARRKEKRRKQNIAQSEAGKRGFEWAFRQIVRQRFPDQFDELCKAADELSEQMLATPRPVV